MKTTYNLLYGIFTGIAFILLISTAIASLTSGQNLFGFPNFWTMFVPVAGIALYLNTKRIA